MFGNRVEKYASWQLSLEYFSIWALSFANNENLRERQIIIFSDHRMTWLGSIRSTLGIGKTRDESLKFRQKK